MQTKIITIDLGHHEYDVYIGSNLLYRMQDFIPFDVGGKTAFLIADENTQYYAEALEQMLQANGIAAAHKMVLPSGERTKSFDQFRLLCDWMLDRRVSRDSIVLAVGGGVIGDLAGFAAASVLRGVPYLQVPTSLLGQVDSSVGGKTGINTAQGKNLIGAFYQPQAVVIDLDTLKTLPQRELLAGYAEIVKYGLIGDSAFYEWLEENGRAVCQLDYTALSYAIEASVRAKANLVIDDEKERGRRALLNLGHTFGHALEVAAKYDGRLLHGEAVAIGMVMAFDLSARMELCSRSDAERVEEHLISVGLPTRASFISPALQKSAEDLYKLMGSDKKVKDGAINFILASGIGNAFISDDVPKELVLDVLRHSLGGGDAGNHEMVKGRWKQAFSSLSAQS